MFHNVDKRYNMYKIYKIIYAMIPCLYIQKIYVYTFEANKNPHKIYKYKPILHSILTHIFTLNQVIKLSIFNLYSLAFKTSASVERDVKQPDFIYMQTLCIINLINVQY